MCEIKGKQQLGADDALVKAPWVVVQKNALGPGHAQTGTLICNLAVLGESLWALPQTNIPCSTPPPVTEPLG